MSLADGSQAVTWTGLADINGLAEFIHEEPLLSCVCLWGRVGSQFGEGE